MLALEIPKNYSPKLSLKDTQKAIKIIKDTFQENLAKRLNLQRVTAPLMVKSASGINDDLSGVERKVVFDTKEIDGNFEIVQSLAKWKRMALKKYGFIENEGLYTDMNAIRRDDDVDNIHSIFVDQWDWEKIISQSDRTSQYLQKTVKTIVDVVKLTNDKIKSIYPVLDGEISADVFFISSQELENLYPNLDSKSREAEITKKYKTVFISQIGGDLDSGKPHDFRAPDYDDWNLNGDLLFWNDVLQAPLEISSMGIRVDENSLRKQLTLANATDREKFEYHQMIFQNKLPLTIGGGIGQSRLCLLMLQKAHIGEVSVAIWPDDMIEKCKENNIPIL
ncbi:MAG: aspartate--ammonia ligase [Clostridia bacterium]|nr:aspartate--ammonia ligase [Clostridia bacterium]